MQKLINNQTNIDLETFLIVLLCIVDEIYTKYFAPHKPVRPGAKAEMSDVEVLMLALLSQWSAKRSERWMINYARNHWLSYFPRILKQSAFNRRVRDLAVVLCQLGPMVAQHLQEILNIEGDFGGFMAQFIDQQAEVNGYQALVAGYELLDGVAVPIMKRCRGDKHKLFANEADIGKGGSDKEYYYGVKLMPGVSQTGLITGFVFGPASTEERFLAEALFRGRHAPEALPPTGPEMDEILGPTHHQGGKRVGPNGPIACFGAGQATSVPYISDLGLKGDAWQKHWLDTYGVRVLTKDIYKNLESNERKKGCRWLSSLRQPVETTFNWLASDLGLKFPRARSWWGLLARIGAKIAAFNLALSFNYLTGRPTYSLFDPICAATSV